MKFASFSLVSPFELVAHTRSDVAMAAFTLASTTNSKDSSAKTQANWRKFRASYKALWTFWGGVSIMQFHFLSLR